MEDTNLYFQTCHPHVDTSEFDDIGGLNVATQIPNIGELKFLQPRQVNGKKIEWGKQLEILKRLARIFKMAKHIKVALQHEGGVVTHVLAAIELELTT